MAGRSEDQKRHYAKKQAAIDEFKNRPCADCGGRFPSVCMDLHHKDPATKSTKLKRVNTSLQHLSWKDLAEELAKCEVLCANCHRLKGR